MSSTGGFGASTRESETMPVKVVGFERRLIATFVDGLIIIAVSTLIAALLAIITLIGSLYRADEDIPYNVLFTGAGLVVSLLYYVGYWSKSGATIAKDVLGLKVVDRSGRPPSVGTALLRYIGYVVSAAVLSLGFLWIVFDKKRQGWHDKIAGTFVVDSDYEPFDAEAVEIVFDEGRKGWLWGAVWLILAIGMPGTLLVSLVALGPSVNRLVTDLLDGLR